MGRGIKQGVSSVAAQDNKKIGKAIEDLKKEANAYKDSATQITLSLKDIGPNTSNKIVCLAVEENAKTTYHKHDYIEINYVYEGRCIQYISDKLYYQREGELIIFSPGVFHSYYTAKNAKMITVAINKSLFYKFETEIRDALPDSFLSKMRSRSVYMLFKKNDEMFPHDIIMRLLYESGNQDNLGKLSMEHYAKLLLLMLCRCKNQNNVFMDEKVEKYLYTGAESIVQYISENYATVSLSELSAKFGYSATHIYRIIKTYTGKSYSDLLLSYKLQKAKTMLETTKIPISKIAEITGLGSSENFSRTFKANFGKTPTQYRSSNTNNTI